MLKPGVAGGCCDFLTEKSPQARDVMAAVEMAGLAGYWLFTGCKVGYYGILTLHIYSCCIWQEALGVALLVLLNCSTFVVPLINLTDHCQAQSQTQRFSQQQNMRGGEESRQLFSFACFLCSHCMLMCKLECPEHTAVV